MLLAFGASFELPVLLTLLGRVGILSSDALVKARQDAIVGIAAAAAVLTPPDVSGQFLLGIPVYILFEIASFRVRRFEKKREEEEAEEEAELAACEASQSKNAGTEGQGCKPDRVVLQSFASVPTGRW